MTGCTGLDRQVSGRGSENKPGPESRKRYYILSQDFRRPFDDIRFLNQDDVLVGGRTAGRHEHRVPGYRTAFATGLPPLLATPRISIGNQTDARQDLYGTKPWFVSDRAKTLIADIDPGGFEFVECDTFDGQGKSIPSYWMMDAIRIVNEFDEEQSDFETLNRGIVELNDIHMSPTLPDEYHSFYFPRYPTYFIVDALIADAWRSASLTGAVFTPLQPPIERDLGADKDEPDYLLFKNYPYWSRKGLSL